MTSDRPEVPSAPAAGSPAGPSASRRPASLIESWRMTESPLVKRLLWSGLLAGTGALASIAAARLAAVIWTRVFGEEPPE
jgi:hypothetical protein